MSRHTYIGIGSGKSILFIAICAILTIFALPAHSADVLILGNSKLKPVADVISGIQKTINADVTVISTADTHDSIESIVRKKNVSAVIALGTDAVVNAEALPESIPVVYGLVIDPIETKRKNITGVYMSTPVSEYISFISKNFPGIKKLGIICPHGKKEHIKQHVAFPEIELREAGDPYEFIDRLSTLAKEVDAVLLLPERDLITSRVIEEVYLFSFRENVPVIGISEKYVKIGSLFSLGFDTSAMGRQIGEIANKVLAAGSASGMPGYSPDRLDFYVNTKTSQAMHMSIPDNLLKKAKKVYP